MCVRVTSACFLNLALVTVCALFQAQTLVLDMRPLLDTDTVASANLGMDSAVRAIRAAT
jgi:hypothetical protein